LEQSKSWSHPWRRADRKADPDPRPETAAPTGFADYDVGTLEAYLNQRNAAFGYPLRSWNGRWIAAGGRSFDDFRAALDETRRELARCGDTGFNDTIFGLFGLDFHPADNARHGLPVPLEEQWQILDGRHFHSYGDAEYETFRLCPGLFEKGLTHDDRARLVDGVLGAIPAYRTFLTLLAEHLQAAGGTTANVVAFWRNRSRNAPPAAWLAHAPHALERRGLGIVIDHGRREVGFKLHPQDFDFRKRLEPRPFEIPGLPQQVPVPAIIPAWQRWLRPRRVLKSVMLLLAALFLWLSVTAPLSNSLRPAAAPSITVLASDGRPVARRGAISDEPVTVEELPPHVSQAFLAIEDHRFYAHIGVDPWGIARAMMRNLLAGGVREGGSTITQQLAKTSFLTADRTAARKARELVIALWLEVWLSKEEILSRYLSNVYFGDNVYGLRAAARHYFDTTPERLTVPQAAMLAAVVNAPSRLAPTRNLSGAQARSRLVMRAMADAGFISENRLRGLQLATVRRRPPSAIPTGTYFADWILPAVPDSDEPSYVGREVQSTLDRRLQRIAVQTIREARIGGAEAALVAMRPDGRVVAMLGGRDYARSPFNRATQARRQPGSTFKLFVYLAALRNGMRPDSLVEDRPITVGEYQPRNHGGTYRGRITLAQAFAQSSNVAAVRLAERVGMDEVIRAARDLGVSARLANDPSLALGTGEVSLLEMTAAYAAIANNRYPVRPFGLEPEEKDGWERFTDRLGSRSGGRAFRDLRDMLYLAANSGTGRAAALRTATFGKTGTTQDYRDALFIGFAGDLVVGIWVGNDDNSPMRGVTGGGAPARIWRSFMSRALRRE
jgi:penicillin-binding protein 1A